MTAGRWDATKWGGKCVPRPLPAACGLIWNNICEGTCDTSIQQCIWWAKVSVMKFLVQGNQDTAALASACLDPYHPTPTQLSQEWGLAAIGSLEAEFYSAPLPPLRPRLGLQPQGWILLPGQNCLNPQEGYQQNTLLCATSIKKKKKGVIQKNCIL